MRNSGYTHTDMRQQQAVLGIRRRPRVVLILHCLWLLSRHSLDFNLIPRLPVSDLILLICPDERFPLLLEHVTIDCL